MFFFCLARLFCICWLRSHFFKFLFIVLLFFSLITFIYAANAVKNQLIFFSSNVETSKKNCHDNRGVNYESQIFYVKGRKHGFILGLPAYFVEKIVAKLWFHFDTHHQWVFFMKYDASCSSSTISLWRCRAGRFGPLKKDRITLLCRWASFETKIEQKFAETSQKSRTLMKICKLWLKIQLFNFAKVFSKILLYRPLNEILCTPLPPKRNICGCRICPHDFLTFSKLFSLE